jgi:uncharacterized protein (DUF1501 family)
MKRRNFLKNISAGVAIPTLINGIGVRALASNPLASLTDSLTTDTDHVLVVIQLAGGNDGLNTVVPLDQYSHLYNGRQNIILPENSVLPLTGTTATGLHPSLGGLRDLYDNGELRIVQSVGYPNPNYSHFRSTDIWMSGANSDEYLGSGWAGRYLNYEYPNYPIGYPNTDVPHPLAIEIGYSMSLSMMGPQNGMSFVIADTNAFYNLIAGVQDPAPNTPAGEQLAYVRLIAQQSKVYSQVIVDASNTVASQQPYPDSYLANNLKIVARLIAGGLKTRMYVVSMGGFDTHNTQVMDSDHTQGTHAMLLQQLGDAIKAFTNDIQSLGLSDRVTGMTYSEFGRRMASNASGGTDHGEAAPMFLFGKKILPGIMGTNPVIPPTPTDYDNVNMQFDFRSVYATLLRDWFCVPDADVSAILLHSAPYLNLFQQPLDCIATAVHEVNNAAGLSLLECAPNPFQSTLRITYQTEGGSAMVQLMDTAGNIVATPVNTSGPKGTYTVDWAAGDLPAGTYFCRLINGMQSQTKMVVKIR